MIGSFTSVIGCSMSGFASDGTGIDDSGFLLPSHARLIKGFADDESGMINYVWFTRILSR